VAGLPNASIVQGDIYRLPCPEGSFDQVFCIGVIHHLPDPRAGFMALTRMLKPGGKISLWVYAAEGNELVARYFEPFRKRVSSKLPWGLTKALSMVAAAVMWLLITALYAPARALWPALWERLPMHDYLWYIYRLGFHTLYHTAFDKLSPELCTFITREELEAWFAAAGLGDVAISHRNGNSWRAQGRAPLPASPGGEGEEGLLSAGAPLPASPGGEGEEGLFSAGASLPVSLGGEGAGSSPEGGGWEGAARAGAIGG
jgi:SAM-dependent methyltransferase